MANHCVKIVINSTPVTLNAPADLHSALQHWQTETRINTPVACALNGEFVPRSAYRETALADGDHIDIVQPVGGG